MTRRKQSIATTCTLALLGAPGWAATAQAQAYPAKPVRIVVPFPPGGGADIFARVVGQKMTAALGQAFVRKTRTR